MRIALDGVPERSLSDLVAKVQRLLAYLRAVALQLCASRIDLVCVHAQIEGCPVAPRTGPFESEVRCGVPK